MISTILDAKIVQSIYKDKFNQCKWDNACSKCTEKHNTSHTNLPQSNGKLHKGTFKRGEIFHMQPVTSISVRLTTPGGRDTYKLSLEASRSNQTIGQKFKYFLPCIVILFQTLTVLSIFSLILLQIYIFVVFKFKIELIISIN